MASLEAGTWAETLANVTASSAFSSASRMLSSGGGKTILDGEPFPNGFALFLAQVAVILALSKFMSWMLRYVSSHLSFKGRSAHR